MGTHPIFESDFDRLTEMTRFGLIHKYARVWNEAPWVERLMWKQQEMRYMWNSKHAFDGGAFYRTMGRFTERASCLEESGKPEMWGHFHSADKTRAEEECRLFELTKNIANYGVGRLVYNKYEMSYKSKNLEILRSGNKSELPETFWLITRAWNDWNTPDTDPVTNLNHVGNFGYAYGIIFHQGETDGLEREFKDHLNPGWYLIPKDEESYFIENKKTAKEVLKVVRKVPIPPFFNEIERTKYEFRNNINSQPSITVTRKI